MLLGARSLRREPPPPPTFPLTFVDDEGIEGSISKAPERIVSFAPHFTETLFEVGAGEAIVGVSPAETYPPEATALPSLAGPDGITPDAERVVAAQPDVVISSGMPGAPWKQELRDTGIPVVTLDATSIDDALSDMEMVGKIAGRVAEAGSLRRRIEASIAEIEPRPDRPTVFFETFNPPLIAAGVSSYVGDLVAAAGGSVAGPPLGYEVWNLEQIIEADPDVYLATRSTAESAAAVRGRPGYERLRAVAENRVHVIDDELVTRPGPRLAEGVRTIMRLLSGE